LQRRLTIKILALESSAKAASAALWEDGKCRALYYQNCGLTHSKTLLPMTEDLLNNCGIRAGDIDLLAVSSGPGSFTGLRIGTATVKGLMWGLDKPACGVSTLEAMAWQVCACFPDKIICAAMDAKRSQIYNALFLAGKDGPERLTEDRAISMDELKNELRCFDKEIMLVGDGAELCYSSGINAILAPENIRYQNAWGVALAAAAKDKSSWGEPELSYLRLSQAERERLEKLDKDKEF
jgi:tRNA threonylcarbamoyladenosine biosynthesis protein TsaB